MNILSRYTTAYAIIHVGVGIAAIVSQIWVRHRKMGSQVSSIGDCTLVLERLDWAIDVNKVAMIEFIDINARLQVRI